MQTPKARNSSAGAPQKISPRKITGLEGNSVSSTNQASRTPKDRSPKVTDRRSPRSPASERKRPSRVSVLESQISQLQEDLKKVKDQLNSSESRRKQAQQDAAESKKRLSAMSSKLEDSQKQLLELSASEEAHVIELQKVSLERDRAWQSELEAVQKQHSVDSAALSSAMSEIQLLKVQLDMVAESEAAQTEHPDSIHAELQILRENLAETLSVVDNLKKQLSDCKASEVEAQKLIGETLLQLETAKKTVETLSLDGAKAKEAYNAIALELNQSRTRVYLLEGLVNQLQVDVADTGNSSQNPAGFELEIRENEKIRKSLELEAELTSVEAEVGQLKTTLDASEIRYHEEQIGSTLQIRSVYEFVDQIKSVSCQREAELKAELNKTKADIEELKENLMDKETELQGIMEENERLTMKLEKNWSCQRENDLEKELKKSKEDVEELKANLMDKETELQNISEENEILNLEIRKKELNRGKVNDEVAAELKAAKGAERDALMNLGFVKEEADNSNGQAARVGEQLKAAQAKNSEMEAELRRLKVQSDQWRKAAEAATAILATGNDGQCMERTGSMDSNYNPIIGKISSTYSENVDDDFLKKKNGNMLKKIGVLWKKPQK